MLPDRIHSLDIARGFASLSVVLWHWQCFFFDHYEIKKDFQRDLLPCYQFLKPFYNRGGHIAVSFFFVLSGFVFFWLYRDRIANRNCSLWEFISLRIARLYPLHLATLVIVLVLQLAYFSINDAFFVFQYNDARHFLLHLLFASYWGFENGWSFNAPIWSVSVEIVLYAIFFTAAFFGQTSFVRCIAIIGAVITLQHFGVAWRWTGAIEAFFLGGLAWHAIAWYSHRRNSTADFCIVIVAIASWTAAAASTEAADLLLERYHIYLWFVCPISVAALVILELRFARMLEKCSWIGDITYATYLLHFPLLLAFAMIATMFGYTMDIFYSQLSLFLFFGTLIPLSLMTYHNFERPMQSRLRGLLLGNRVRPHSGR